MTLDKLPVGGSAVITAVGGEGALRCHLLDMGLIPKTTVKVNKVAPMGDPIELHLRGYILTIRIEDAQKISIEPLEESLADENEKKPNTSKKNHRDKSQTRK